jgi:hypothetical protein
VQPTAITLRRRQRRAGKTENKKQTQVYQTVPHFLVFPSDASLSACVRIKILLLLSFQKRSGYRLSLSSAGPGDHRRPTKRKISPEKYSISHDRWKPVTIVGREIDIAYGGRAHGNISTGRRVASAIVVSISFSL